MAFTFLFSSDILCSLSRFVPQSNHSKWLSTVQLVSELSACEIHTSPRRACRLQCPRHTSKMIVLICLFIIEWLRRRLQCSC